MKASRAILQILYHKKIQLLIYMLIPLILTMIFRPAIQSADNFETPRAKVVLNNLDKDSPVAQELGVVLEKDHDLVPMPETEEALQNGLFYGSIDYILEIPAGFFEARSAWIREGSDPDLQASLPTLKHTRSSSGTYLNVEMLVNRYLQFFELQAASTDRTLTQISAHMQEGLDIQNSLDIHAVDTQWSQAMDFNFRFMAYGLLASIFFMVTMVFASLKKPQVLTRQNVSPVTTSRIGAETTLTILLFTLMLVAAYVIYGIIAFRPKIFSSLGVIAMLNLLIFAMVCLTLSFFVSVFVRKEVAIEALGNIIPLALSFFGGIFVPLSILSDSIRKIAQLTPTYWYSQTLDLLGEHGELTPAVRAGVMTNFGILLIFATVFLLLALGATYAKGRRSSDQIRTKARYG